MCGWAIQTKLVTDELRRRGHQCDVLKINENRTVKDSKYIDVQGPWDFARKVIVHALRDFRLNVHVNGMSKKGFLIALFAALVGRAVNEPALVTFHGGRSQEYFPSRSPGFAHWAFRILFTLAGAIACDSAEVKDSIVDYGIRPDKVSVIPTFSAQYVNFTPAKLPQHVDDFLAHHDPVIFSYVSFRPEYRLPLIRQCISEFRKRYPASGFVWLGFPEKEFSSAQQFVRTWTTEDQRSLLLLGNLEHDPFLTLMARSSAYLRTPVCDGVAASVLEALALGVPVVASDNGVRPAGVITYKDDDASEMCARLIYVTEHYSDCRATLPPKEDNISSMADWLAGEPEVRRPPEVVRAG
jgi:glycosyltransferase involved in cell wall biosynthesis